tara:strand:+ start:672 stop:1646 length:975 start_codon:yes stop_codon:yes gene_type:complete
MATNFTVSSDVDTMLRSTNNASILSNIGAVSTSDLANKANIVDPTFTGTATFSGGTVNLDNSTSNKIVLENGNLDQATLELSSGSLKLKAHNSSGSGGLGTFLKADVNGTPSDEVSLDASFGTLHLIGDKEVKIQSEGDITLDADDNGEVAITGSCGIVGDLNVNGDHTINTGRLNVREIQCQGGTTNTAIPINYDAKEHRFRDFDGSTDHPKNMLVVQKFDGYTGARIGINKDPSSSNAVALHVVAGKNNSTDVEDLGLKVVGGSFFEDFIRVGHYESSDSSGNDTRPTSPNNGTIIYDKTTHTFQGYIGGGASGGWKTFNMS